MVGNRRTSPTKFHSSVALAVTIVLTASCWWLLGRKTTWPMLLICWLLAVNVVAFLYYGYDKMRARQGGNRVPEMVLHGLTAAGGGLGAFLAMHLFRHKTVKGSFRVLFWSIVVLQALLAIWLVQRLT